MARLADMLRAMADTGPIDHGRVKAIANASFTIRPVIDIEGHAPVDAYEIPGRHGQAGSLIKRGQSRIGKCGPMTPFHHRIRTHAGWDLEQPFPGIYFWRDPFGAINLVDHTAPAG